MKKEKDTKEFKDFMKTIKEDGLQCRINKNIKKYEKYHGVDKIWFQFH
jgi:hypothetical protein